MRTPRVIDEPGPARLHPRRAPLRASAPDRPRLDAGIEAIEAVLIRRRDRPPRLTAAFRQAMGMVGVGDAGTAARPSGSWVPGLHAAGLRIMAVAGRWSQDLPYHSRHHAVEAMLAMGLLCRAARDLRLLSVRDAAVGVVAMAGHDLFHDGSPASDGVLEARAASAVQDYAAGAAARDRALLGSVILATDPERVEATAAVPIGPGSPGRDVLHRLANEADVFASLLPTLGLRMGRLLAEEWRGRPDRPAQPVDTACGRLRFLTTYPPLSPPAVALGLEAARRRSIEAYAEAAVQLRAGSSPQDGCAALDRLPDADRAYLAALATLPPLGAAKA